MFKVLETYSGSATILQGELRAIVSCSFEVEQEMVEARQDEFLEGLMSWQGSFSTDEFLLETDCATLKLPDGRSGEIIITHLTLPAGIGSFSGNGAPPS